MTSNENGCLYGQSQIDQKGKMNWLTSYLVRLVDHVGHNFIVYLCPNWSTKNSPIRTKHKSLYVLFGYIVVDHVGKVIFIQSCPFWSTLHTPIRLLYLKIFGLMKLVYDKYSDIMTSI